MKLGKEIYIDNGITITWNDQGNSFSNYFDNLSHRDYVMLNMELFGLNNETRPYKMRSILKQKINENR